MTILKESERKLALVLYGYGWSFSEITQRINENRATAIFYDMQREVTHIVAHRFSKQGEQL